jgi:transposase
MTVAITRRELAAADLRAAASRSKNAAAARRMLALALVMEGRSEAARAAGMDRQTLRDWVHRYNESGLAGLHNAPERGRPPRKLTAEQDATVAGCVPRADGGPQGRPLALRRSARRDRAGVRCAVARTHGGQAVGAAELRARFGASAPVHRRGCEAVMPGKIRLRQLRVEQPRRQRDGSDRRLGRSAIGTVTTVTSSWGARILRQPRDSMARAGAHADGAALIAVINS